MTLGASILGLSFLWSSYPPRQRNSSSSFSSPVQSKIQESSNIVVETTCQPVLQDHGSCWLECKRRFLLATPVAKSFAFVWLLWKDKLAKHLLVNRSHEPDTPTKVSCLLLPPQALLISWCGLLSSPFKFLIGLSMADKDSLQDSWRGVPGNIQIPQEKASVASAALVASQGSAAVFQQRAHHTLLEIEQDKVVVCKGDRGLPDSKVYVANWIAATQSLLSKFLGSFHLQSKNAAGKNV